MENHDLNSMLSQGSVAALKRKGGDRVVGAYGALAIAKQGSHIFPGLPKVRKIAASDFLIRTLNNASRTFGETNRNVITCRRSPLRTTL